MYIYTCTYKKLYTIVTVLAVRGLVFVQFGLYYIDKMISQ